MRAMMTGLNAESDFQSLEIDEAAIEQLNLATTSSPFDETLLTKSPAQEITLAVTALIEKLQKVKIDNLLRNHGLLSRFTGADIEARLIFELEVRSLFAQMEHVSTLVEDARSMLATLELTEANIALEQGRLIATLEKANILLQRGARGEPALKVRFERRLANIQALVTSNDLTRCQINLAKDNLVHIIDSIRDTELVVFPLWQRNALALAQAEPKRTDRAPRISAFLKSHKLLLEHLIIGDKP